MNITIGMHQDDMSSSSLETIILTTTKNKRWNGKLETLAADYLKDVLVQMETYGERVQFALNGPGQRPNYQVTNTAGKKMAFDQNNHLMHPKDDELSGANISGTFTLAQIKTAKSSVGVRASAGTRATKTSSGAPRTTSAAAKAGAMDEEKYEYFKAHRQTLPPAIKEYSNEISELMKKGMTAEEAFNDVLTRYF